MQKEFVHIYVCRHVSASLCKKFQASNTWVTQLHTSLELHPSQNMTYLSIYLYKHFWQYIFGKGKHYYR